MNESASAPPSIHWRIITGEYPPARGGVGDYTRSVARGLAAAGDRVEVWAPENRAAAPADNGVALHRLPGQFGPRALIRLARELPAGGGARILVQYTPHAYGMRAMNLPFCLWLRLHAARGDSIDVMFHEVNFPFLSSDPWRYRALAAATSAMARMVGGSAARAFVSTPAWEPRLRPWLRAGARIVWTPVPSNIPVSESREQIAAARQRFAPREGLVVGHFATCGGEIGRTLDRVVPFLLSGRRDLSIVMIGADGAAWRAAFAGKYPEFAPRTIATGEIPANEISCAISACDLMLQPYPDGATTRRTSLATPLAHGRAIVTTAGALTEPLWAESGAVEITPAGEFTALGAAASALLDDEARRARLGRKALALYRNRFALRHTIAALREL